MKNKRFSLSQQEIEQRLVAAGVQPTLQRISICQFVLCKADHPTAEEVHTWAEKNLSKISLATVYNTLNTLVKTGLLKEFRFPHTEKVIYDNNLEAHYHFLDEETDKLYDIAVEDVKVIIEKNKNFKVNKMEVLLKGQFRK